MTIDASNPRYEKLLELVQQLSIEWDMQRIPPGSRVFGFSRDTPSYSAGYSKGQADLREQFLRANGLL